MFIQTQSTPNPHTMKFIPGMKVLASGSISFVLGDEVAHIPLVKELFEIKGVTGVFLTEEFITITKASEVEWEIIKPMALPTILDNLVAGRPIVIINKTSNRVSNDVGLEDEVVKQIKAIIEEQVRPAVAQDGGDIIFRDFVDGVVYLELHGSCAGCPSSSVTLKNGVENMLRHYVPEVHSVEAV